jgi:putative spermidine/putrescine transport system substrate-binding protein
MREELDMQSLNVVSGHTLEVAMTRRNAIASSMVSGVALALGCPLIAQAQPASLTFPNSGGALEEAYRAAYFDTFTAKTHINVLSAPYMDSAQIKAMVDNNAVSIDLANSDATDAAILARAGLLERIDYDIVDRKSLLPEAAQEFYLLPDFAAYVMAWNTKSFNNATRPQNWAEFFDIKAKPGQRSLWKAAPQTLEVAAIGGGQPPDKLYPLDLDRAFAKLDAIKSSLSWWESGAQGAQLIIGGEVDVGTVWNGRLFKPKAEGAPADFTFDGALVVADAMVVPKGAKNKRYAMQFLANMMEAKNQAVFCRMIPYGPANTETFALLTEAERARLANSPQNRAKTALQDFAYWAEHGAELNARFNRWLVG